MIILNLWWKLFFFLRVYIKCIYKSWVLFCYWVIKTNIRFLNLLATIIIFIFIFIFNNFKLLHFVANLTRSYSIELWIELKWFLIIIWTRFQIFFLLIYRYYFSFIILNDRYRIIIIINSLSSYECAIWLL